MYPHCFTIKIYDMASKLRQASQRLKDEAQQGLTFNFDKVDIKLTKNNTAYRVVCSNGQTIKWFESYEDGTTCDDLVEEIDDDGNMRVIHGVTVSPTNGALFAPSMSRDVWD